MPWCDRCDKGFRYQPALEQHFRDSSFHWICNDCNIDFSSWPALKEHYVQGPNHHYCQYCDEHFDWEDELDDHYQEEHYWCTDCNRMFKDKYGLREHLRQSPRHHYCASCEREFSSENALRNHLNSSVHRPKTVPCLAPNCDQWFVSRSAMILHLESGACPSGVTRARVNDYVRRMDRNNVITNPSRLLTDGTETKYTANYRSWNGDAYECYICHAEFSTLPGLNQHLNSARHQAKQYFCPLTTCRVEFRALSGLLQHIESESCGVSKFRTVTRTLEDVFTNGRGLLAY